MPHKTRTTEFGTEPITFRLNRTRLEQIELLRNEQRRTKAHMVQVLVEDRLDQIFEERRRRK